MMTLTGAHANAALRLRLYDNTTARTADLARAIGDPYASGAGLRLEVVLTSANSYTIDPLSPFVQWAAAQGVVTMYWTVDNLSGVANDLVADLSYLAT